MKCRVSSVDHLICCQGFIRPQVDDRLIHSLECWLQNYFEYGVQSWLKTGDCADDDLHRMKCLETSCGGDQGGDQGGNQGFACQLFPSWLRRASESRLEAGCDRLAGGRSKKTIQALREPPRRCCATALLIMSFIDLSKRLGFSVQLFQHFTSQNRIDAALIDSLFPEISARPERPRPRVR